MPGRVGLASAGRYTFTMDHETGDGELSDPDGKPVFTSVNDGHFVTVTLTTEDRSRSAKLDVTKPIPLAVAGAKLEEQPRYFITNKGRLVIHRGHRKIAWFLATTNATTFFIDDVTERPKVLATPTGTTNGLAGNYDFAKAQTLALSNQLDDQAAAAAYDAQPENFTDPSFFAKPDEDSDERDFQERFTVRTVSARRQRLDLPGQSNAGISNLFYDRDGDDDDTPACADAFSVLFFADLILVGTGLLATAGCATIVLCLGSATILTGTIGLSLSSAQKVHDVCSGGEQLGIPLGS